MTYTPEHEDRLRRTAVEDGSVAAALGEIASLRARLAVEMRNLRARVGLADELEKMREERDSLRREAADLAADLQRAVVERHSLKQERDEWKTRATSVAELCEKAEQELARLEANRARFECQKHSAEIHGSLTCPWCLIERAEKRAEAIEEEAALRVEKAERDLDSLRKEAADLAGDLRRAVVERHSLMQERDSLRREIAEKVRAFVRKRVSSLYSSDQNELLELASEIERGEP